MTDRPILMSGAMVRALLAGRKTQTRRLAWREKVAVGISTEDATGEYPGSTAPNRLPVLAPTIWQSVKPGDRLWVRETWRTDADRDGLRPKDVPTGAPLLFECDDPERTNSLGLWGKIRVSIHMPRRFSRLTLLVTATKMERLQEISEEDAIAEGVLLPKTMSPLDAGVHRQCFIWLWNELHGKGPADYTAWQNNSEIVALTFTVERRNIDA